MDDYGTDMLIHAEGFTVAQDNAVCRWIADAMPGELTESFLRTIEAL